MHVYKIRKWHPAQPGSAVDIFINQRKLEAMKMLSGHRDQCCGKHQFHAKMTVRT